jgi:hypothetical protein
VQLLPLPLCVVVRCYSVRSRSCSVITHLTCDVDEWQVHGDKRA